MGGGESRVRADRGHPRGGGRGPGCLFFPGVGRIVVTSGARPGRVVLPVPTGAGRTPLVLGPGAVPPPAAR